MGMIYAEAEAQLRQVLMNHAYRRFEGIRNQNIVFSHYTSAENALNILGGQEVWLRNSDLMNDFREVSHGEECIFTAWKKSDLSERFEAVLNRVEQGLADKVYQRFGDERWARRLHTYMISISEHDLSDRHEALYGRLSMWRAYGGNTNVALTFKTAPFLSDSNAFNAYTSPVLYADTQSFQEEFSHLVSGLEAAGEALDVVGPDYVAAAVIQALHFAALSTKHPAFKEEREWRVLYSPKIGMFAGQETTIREKVVTIGGIPQIVNVLPLRNVPEKNFVGATIPELLNGIIIGPTAHPYPIYHALVSKLNSLDVPDAERKVTFSDVPLRR